MRLVQEVVDYVELDTTLGNENVVEDIRQIHPTHSDRRLLFHAVEETCSFEWEECEVVDETSLHDVDIPNDEVVHS